MAPVTQYSMIMSLWTIKTLSQGKQWTITSKNCPKSPGLKHNISCPERILLSLTERILLSLTERILLSLKGFWGFLVRGQFFGTFWTVNFEAKKNVDMDVHIIDFMLLLKADTGLVWKTRTRVSFLPLSHRVYTYDNSTFSHGCEGS